MATPIDFNDFSVFFPEKHRKFFKRCLQVLPERYAAVDTTRLTIAFFAVSGLDIIQSLHMLDSEKDEMIEWLYSLQVLPDLNDPPTNLDRCGFRGCSANGHNFLPNVKRWNSVPHDSCHIAMTYTGLLSLLILGDDFSRVDRKAVVQGLKGLQLPDGSYVPMPEGGENDLRFIYCACCISYMLNDWSGMDIPKAIDYIRSSLSYEGGLGQGPLLEAHGGSTYCGLASLVLIGKLNDVFTDRQIRRMKKWLLSRQEDGFTGRPGKPTDTCYSFWVGASLKLLGSYDMISFTKNRDFLMTTQDGVTGGFAKWPDSAPDVLHSYMAIAGLSLMSEPDILPINAALNCTVRTHDHLKDVQKQWCS